MRYRLEVRLTPAGSFAVRTRDGQLVVIPAGRALAGKVVPPPPAPRRRAGPKPP